MISHFCLSVCRYVADSLLPITVTPPPPPPRRPHTPTYKSSLRTNRDCSPIKQTTDFPYPRRTPSYPILQPICKQTENLSYPVLVTDSSCSSNFASPQLSPQGAANASHCLTNAESKKANSIALSTATATAPLQMPHSWSVPNVAAGVANPVRRDTPGPFAVLVGCCAFATTIIALVIAAAVLATAFSTIGRRHSKQFSESTATDTRRNDDLARDVAFALAHHNARRFYGMPHPQQAVNDERVETRSNEQRTQNYEQIRVSDFNWSARPDESAEQLDSHAAVPKPRETDDSNESGQQNKLEPYRHGYRRNRQKRIFVSLNTSEYSNENNETKSSSKFDIKLLLPSNMSTTVSSSLLTVYGNKKPVTYPSRGLKITHWSSAALKHNVSEVRRAKILFRTPSTVTIPKARSESNSFSVARTNASTENATATVTASKQSIRNDPTGPEVLTRDGGSGKLQRNDSHYADTADDIDDDASYQTVEQTKRRDKIGMEENRYDLLLEPLSHEGADQDTEVDATKANGRNNAESVAGEDYGDDYGVLPVEFRSTLASPTYTRNVVEPYRPRDSDNFDTFGMASRDTLSLVAVMCASLFPFLTALLVYSLLLKRKRRSRLAGRSVASTDSSPSCAVHGNDNGTESWTVVYSRRRSRIGRSSLATSAESGAATTVINMGNVRGLSYKRMGKSRV